MMAPSTIWFVLGLFTAAGMAIALRAARENRGTAEDYFLGGRRIGGLISGLSYAATTYSAFMLVVLTGLTYRGGVGALGFELIYFAGLSLLVWFAPRVWLAGRRWGFVSPAEMVGARYGDPVTSRLMAVLALVFLLPYCTTQMAGVGLLLSGVTGGGISLAQAVAVGAALAMAWTLLAGLRSVAWTDAALAAVMMVSGLLAVGFALSALGGPGAAMASLRAEKSAWLAVPGPTLWSLPTFLALSIPWFFFPLSNPQVAQRLFMVRSVAAMRRMILWVLGFGLVFTLIAVVWGLLALQLAPGLANPSLATPALLTSGALPTWAALALIVGIVAAAVSTLDSIALTAAAMVARDLLPRRSEGAQILVGRVVVIAAILFAAGFALRSARIVDQLAALSAAGLMVTVPPFIGAFVWRGGTAAGARACLVGGAALAVTLVLGLGVSVYNPWLAVSVGGLSTLLFVGVSLMTRPRAQALDFKGELRPDLDRMRVW